MAKVSLTYRYVRGEFAEAMAELYEPVAVAAKAAMKETADAIKRQGRAQITSAGFKRAYANAFRTDVYPRGSRVSANAAVVAYHRVDFSEVFETGVRIGGKPYLWVPIADKRTRVGRKQLRLKDFIARGEQLVMVKRPGKAPLLMGRPLSGMTKPRRATQRAAYQRYQAGGLVPLFVGLTVVDIDKKLSIYPMIDAEAGRIAERYFSNLRDE